MFKDALAGMGALFVALIIVCWFAYIKAKIKEKYKKYKCARTQKCDFRQCKSNKYGHCFDNPAYCAFNYLSAKEQKQIPKKPVEIINDNECQIGARIIPKGAIAHKCPVCDSFTSRSCNYCQKCGQALDWSEEK